MTQLHVLIVDDSLSARFAIQRGLEKLEVKVSTAKSGREALALLQTLRPDAIFMDHVMPDLDGLETLARLRQSAHLPQVPVVICSSNDSAEYVAQARTQGAAEVIHKPPEPSEMERIVAALRRGNLSPAVSDRAAPGPASETAVRATPGTTGTPPSFRPAPRPEPERAQPSAGASSSGPTAAAQVSELQARVARLEESLSELAAQTRALTERIEGLSERAAHKAAAELTRRLAAALANRVD